MIKMPRNIWSDGTVEVVGTVTKEPEIKKIGEKETLIVNFNLALSRWKEEKQSFCSCSAFGKLASAILEIKKGDIVHVIGKNEKRSYTDRNGVNQTKNNIACDFISIMGKQGHFTNNILLNNENVNASNITNNQSSTEEEIFSVIGDSSDLPF